MCFAFRLLIQYGLCARHNSSNSDWELLAASNSTMSKILVLPCGLERNLEMTTILYSNSELMLRRLQALVQASFALPQALAAALVNCSVQLPRPLTHLAAVFDQHGLYLADVLPDRPWVKQVPHHDGRQFLLENACQGLGLQQVLPLFAEIVKRYRMSIQTHTA
jgi:hypothetical protein